MTQTWGRTAKRWVGVAINVGTPSDVANAKAAQRPRAAPHHHLPTASARNAVRRLLQTVRTLDLSAADSDCATNARQSLSRGSGRERFQAVERSNAAEAFRYTAGRTVERNLALVERSGGGRIRTSVG
jgi:hypothetical protein